MAHPTRLLVLIGPSGCGKSTLLHALAQRHRVELAPTWTDRPRRADDSEGEHHFVASAVFDQAAAAGHFLAVVQPFDLPYRYGLPTIPAASDSLLVVVIRAAYVTAFRGHYPAAVVYQLEADYDFVTRSVSARDDADHGSRLTDFGTEIQAGRSVADRVFHNDGQHLPKLIIAIERALKRDGLLI